MEANTLCDMHNLREDSMDEANRLTNEVANSRSKYKDTRHAEGFEKLFKVAEARLKLVEALSADTDAERDEPAVDPDNLYNLFRWVDTSMRTLRMQRIEDSLKQMATKAGQRRTAIKEVYNRLKHIKQEIASRSTAIRKEQQHKAAMVNKQEQQQAATTARTMNPSTANKRGLAHQQDDAGDIFNVAFSMSEQMPVYTAATFQEEFEQHRSKGNVPYIVRAGPGSPAWEALLDQDEELRNNVKEFQVLSDNSGKTKQVGRAQLPTLKVLHIQTQIRTFVPNADASTTLDTSGLAAPVANAFTMTALFGVH
jgi:hypothetical protein